MGEATPALSIRPQAPHAVTVVGIHYSPGDHISELVGVAYGRGIPGEEAQRLATASPRLRKRVYFYAQTREGVLPPPEEGLGPHVYRVKLLNLYDPNNDEALDRVSAVRKGKGYNALEEAIIDAGYDGYFNPMSNTLVLLGVDRVPVEYLGDRWEAGRKLREEGTVDLSAHRAATSPSNALPSPTPAQQEAGNYQKGHVRIAGLDVSIENPAGSKRAYRNPDGSIREATLKSHYGYIRRTLAKDGDQLDVFIRPGTPLDWSGPVWVLDQRKPGNGHFDEHKVLIGWSDAAGALQGYRENYAPGWEGARSLLRFDSPEAFRAWLTRMEPGKPALFSRQGRPLQEDLAAQIEWLETQAKERGYESVDQLASRDPQAFEQLAAEWRKEHPAQAPFSRPGRPVWFSALQKAIEEKAPNAASPGLWKTFVAGLKQKGVKQGEIEWSGINDWLDLQGGKVAKEAVLGYLRQNGVSIEEKVLRGVDVSAEMRAWLQGDMPQTVDEWWREVSRLEQYARRIERQGGEAEDRDRYFRLMEEAERHAEELETGAGKAAEIVRYSRYQLPGGRGYRELLLTFPTEASKNVQRFRPPSDSDLRKVFLSQHFAEPNILAHVRFNERADAKGRRVLFIEEIQSDWAQRGRKLGFAPADLEKRIAALEAEAEKLASDREMPSNAIRNESRWHEIRREADALKAKARQSIPTAPFVTDTNAWVALALKRMIRWAAENGFDVIAWTTGEQQAKRYDLSQYIDAILYFKREDGTFDLEFQKGDRSVLEQMGVSEARLSDLVGKDLAEKILSGKGDALGQSGWKVIEGIDFEVGGAGMRAFYDRIVPNVANDVLQKLGGGRVEKTRIPEIGEQPGFEITDELRAKALEGLPLFSRRSRPTDLLTADGPKMVRVGSRYVSEDGRYGLEPDGLGGYFATVEGEEIGWAFSYQDAQTILKRQYWEDLRSGKARRPESETVFNRYSEQQTERLLAGWRRLAEHKGAFMTPKTSATELQQIVRDLRLERLVTIIPMDEADGARQFLLVMPDQTMARLTVEKRYKGGKTPGAWLDARDLNKEGYGRLAYQIALAWAHNNRTPLYPDESLSYINTFRRTEQMISAALKYGTTEYMRPHPDQTLHGWIEEPRFQEEDHNLALMLLTSMERYEENIPKLKELRYNFESRRFETRNGQPFTAGDFDALAETDAARDVGAGRTTLARVVFSRSLVNGGAGARRFVSGELSAGPLLASELPETLRLYSRRSRAGAAPGPVREFAETERAYGGREAYEKAKAEGRTKLNYQQWVQVRTPAFKAWFGDWENDPENVSKVVDPDTGEPMVVYHGSPSRPWRIGTSALGLGSKKKPSAKAA